MLSINVLRLVVHKKNIFKGFCYINLYRIMTPWVWPFVTPGTSFEEI